MPIKKKYDFIILGGGIAGLSSAEILSREGKKILIIEKNKQLMSCASGHQHGWFHFGSLYSIIENKETLNNMILNFQNILKFYNKFPNMNLKIIKNKIIFKKNVASWFNKKRINYYIVSRKHKDLFKKKYLDKVKEVYNWEKKIKLFIIRHKKFEKNLWGQENSNKYIVNSNYFDYSRKFILKPCIKNVDIDPKVHFKIIGFDRTMNTLNISNDLLKSYISNKGEIKLKTSFRKIVRKKNKLFIKTNKGIFETDVLINAMGSNIKKISKVKKIFNIASPIAVFYPKISNENFVKLSPKNDNTINHLIHKSNNKEYSVVSSGLGTKIGGDTKIQKKKIIRIENKFLKLIKVYFAKYSNINLKRMYSGIKTEFLDTKKRNYNYQIFKEADNIYSLLPGKFTLSFSLAVELYKTIYGKLPKSKYKFNNNYVSNIISKPEHSKFF